MLAKWIELVFFWQCSWHMLIVHPVNISTKQCCFPYKGASPNATEDPTYSAIESNDPSFNIKLGVIIGCTISAFCVVVLVLFIIWRNPCRLVKLLCYLQIPACVLIGYMLQTRTKLLRRSLPVISVSMCLQSSFMCVISSFNFSPIASLLVNAVNFPGTTRPFSSSF